MTQAWPHKCPISLATVMDTVTGVAPKEGISRKEKSPVPRATSKKIQTSLEESMGVYG